MPDTRHRGEGRDPLVNHSGAGAWILPCAGMTGVEPLSPACGVKLIGIDLSRPLSAAQQAAIDAAFLAHHVVVFPAQRLSREAQFAFAAHFGEVAAHGAHRPGAANKRYRVAHVMSNLGPDGLPAVRRSLAANYHWHTDKPYLPAPPLLTMLHAVELPPTGGDTEFANMTAAYDVLPAAMKERIAGLRVAFRPAFDDGRPGAEHPLVRTHPDTARKSLYIGNHSTGVVGMPEAEGRALLAELLAHATQPRFVYTHRWRLGDLVMWDNRCLLHRAVLNYDTAKDRRVMHRSVVEGPVPV
jgi:alpha-ketoglutarate-dependent 2,4-dichlorophenoxyacetate dioxygenase